jgi:hypothetical protein
MRALLLLLVALLIITAILMCATLYRVNAQEQPPLVMTVAQSDPELSWQLVGAALCLRYVERVEWYRNSPDVVLIIYTDHRPAEEIMNDIHWYQSALFGTTGTVTNPPGAYDRLCLLGG